MTKHVYIVVNTPTATFTALILFLSLHFIIEVHALFLLSVLYSVLHCRYVLNWSWSCEVLVLYVFYVYTVYLLCEEQTRKEPFYNHSYYSSGPLGFICACVCACVYRPSKLCSADCLADQGQLGKKHVLSDVKNAVI